LRLKKFLASFFLFFIVLQNPAFSTGNIWDVLADEFKLNHELSQPEVQTQIRWLVSHPAYLQKLAQAEPYIYHILSNIKRRHLPGELALIPMIESAYDPFAYSGAGAAGLWQLMPKTGSDLGLKRDWWYDGRRSISASTDAALNYLSYLHKYFHSNWLLAFAAYDAGEGKIAKSIKNTKDKRFNFWQLNLARETKIYIPRLLALSEIIQHPARYHVKLPNILNIPYFTEVNVANQIDLTHAAELAGMSYRELLKLNPGFNRLATAPSKPCKILVPTNRVAMFTNNLRNNHARVVFAANKVPTPKTYKPVTNKKSYKIVHIVQKNENMNYLSKRYNISGTKIAEWNHMHASNKLQPGQQLIIWRNLVA
jgi:membrane-bound lytic murein transglycosylase D